MLGTRNKKKAVSMRRALVTVIPCTYITVPTMKKSWRNWKQILQQGYVENTWRPNVQYLYGSLEYAIFLFLQVSQCKNNGFESVFQSDVQDLQFPLEWNANQRADFDAVFSNAALHWCKSNPRGVLESAKKILKPGGRFVVEMGGFMNCIGKY